MPLPCFIDIAVEELRCGGVAVWGSCGVGELQCGGVVVRGSCKVGECHCWRDALCGGYGGYQARIQRVLDISLVFRVIWKKLFQKFITAKPFASAQFAIAN